MHPFGAQEIQLRAQASICGGLLQRARNLVILGDVRAPAGREFQQLGCNALQRGDAYAWDDARLRSGEKLDLRRQRSGQRIGEGREQHTGVG